MVKLRLTLRTHTSTHATIKPIDFDVEIELKVFTLKEPKQQTSIYKMHITMHKANNNLKQLNDLQKGNDPIKEELYLEYNATTYYVFRVLFSGMGKKGLQ